MAEIQTVGVLGGGLMGSGIAQVAAQAGFDTRVREISDALCERARVGIEKQLVRAVEKGKLGQSDRDAAMRQLRFTTEMEALRDCDIVIEAVTEDLEVKNALWRQLDALCPPETIFASNTSSLTIADMAAATSRPERMVGLHFFNPCR
jgi:3-hydroxybutyryl-CoA dehydrogenase